LLTRINTLNTTLNFYKCQSQQYVHQDRFYMRLVFPAKIPRTPRLLLVAFFFSARLFWQNAEWCRQFLCFRHWLNCLFLGIGFNKKAKL